MTRKRFVKLLMSRGRSRNEANLAALEAASDGFTYEQLYFAVRYNDGDPEIVEAVEAMAERIAKVLADFAQTMRSVAQKIAEAIPAFIEMAEKAKELKETATE